MASQAGILKDILTTTPVDLINTGGLNVMAEGGGGKAVLILTHSTSLAEPEKIGLFYEVLCNGVTNFLKAEIRFGYKKCVLCLHIWQ